jgi:hypothetical protein
MSKNKKDCKSGCDCPCSCPCTNKTIKLLIDTAPYIPDIDINNKKYFSFDKINNQSVITTHQTIFIFNLQYDIGETNSIYDDPKYMLYGIQSGAYTYFYPSTLFFQPNSLTNPYTINGISNTLTPEIAELLKTIGYDISTIVLPTISTFYQSINAYDGATGRTDEVIFIFFYVPTMPSINYNQFLATTFYQEKSWNVWIYPFVAPPSQTPIIYDIHIHTTPNVPNAKNSIENIFFDNRDLCEYIDKIDYKYMEEPVLQHNMSANLQKLTAYSKNLTMFENYVKHNAIFINLNEITKFQYTNDSTNTYTNRDVMIRHINNTKTYNTSPEQDSLTLDNKLAFANNKRFNIDVKYTPYKNNTMNINTAYQISKNYYANCFVSTTEKRVEPYLNIINLYLHKLFVLINPNIIDENYLLLPTTQFTITDITNGNNQLQFGVGVDKDKVFFPSLPLISTSSYYIGIYKVLFSFVGDNGIGIDVPYNYIIILSIAFYNSNNLQIINTNRSLTINDLGFSCSTFLDETLSLIPNMFFINEITTVLNNPVTNGFVDWKYQSYLLNYNAMSEYKSDYDCVNVVHYYGFVSNVQPNITTIDERGNPVVASNVIDVVEQKINNLVQNIIMLNNSWKAVIYNVFNVKTYFMLSLLLDTNIPSRYVDELFWESPAIANNVLPTGHYKVLKYHNHFPLSSPIDDTIATNTTTISQYTQYNYCILIRIPDTFECCTTHTHFYLALCQTNGTIYVMGNGQIATLELFVYYNHNDVGYRVIFNLLANTYCNFYQLNVVAETFNTFTEMNTVVMDYDTICFHEHESKYMEDIVAFDRLRFDGGIQQNKNAVEPDERRRHHHISNCCCSPKTPILLFNLLLMLKNSRKILFYLRLCRLMKMGVFPPILFNFLIILIVFNANKNLAMNLFCYYLRTLYGTNSTFILLVFQHCSNIDDLVTLEQIVGLISEIENVIYAIRWKIRVIINMLFAKKCVTIPVEKMILQYLMEEYLNKNESGEIANDVIMSIIKHNYDKLGVIRDMLAETPLPDSATVDAVISTIIGVLPDSATVDEIQVIANTHTGTGIGNNLLEYWVFCKLMQRIGAGTEITEFSQLNSLYVSPSQQNMFNFYSSIKTEFNELNKKQTFITEMPFSDDVLKFILDEPIVHCNTHYTQNAFIDAFYREVPPPDFANAVDEERRRCCKIHDDTVPLYYNLDFQYVNFNNPEM